MSGFVSVMVIYVDCVWGEIWIECYDCMCLELRWVWLVVIGDRVVSLEEVFFSVFE